MKVYTGKRGGKYIIRNGKRRYLSSFGTIGNPNLGGAIRGIRNFNRGYKKYRQGRKKRKQKPRRVSAGQQCCTKCCTQCLQRYGR